MWHLIETIAESLTNSNNSYYHNIEISQDMYGYPVPPGEVYRYIRSLEARWSRDKEMDYGDYKTEEIPYGEPAILKPGFVIYIGRTIPKKEEVIRPKVEVL